MANSVAFKFGTQLEYNARLNSGTISEPALYFIEDTRRIYRGSLLLGSSDAEFRDKCPDFAEARDSVLYIVNDKTNYHIYVKGDNDMVCINHVVEKGSIKSLDAFKAGLILTDADGVSKDDHTHLLTAGAVVKAISDATSWETL